ncbi:MAG: hypothetical protein GQ532_10050, partial [Methylomarinum sp.]|nr:hypothetical protein [Methylomarinum sp.]
VMCQEIGHAFGLGHQDEGFNNGNLNTCMDYINDPDSNQHPNSHDYSMLESIYNHLESADSGGGDCNPRNPNCRPNANIPSFVSDMEFQGPGPDPQWGNLVQRSMDGHQEVYVLDLGRGNKVITHVTWVESRNRSHHD